MTSKMALDVAPLAATVAQHHHTSISLLSLGLGLCLRGPFRLWRLKVEAYMFRGLFKRIVRKIELIHQWLHVF